MFGCALLRWKRTYLMCKVEARKRSLHANLEKELETQTQREWCANSWTLPFATDNSTIYTFFFFTCLCSVLSTFMEKITVFEIYLCIIYFTFTKKKLFLHHNYTRGITLRASIFAAWLRTSNLVSTQSILHIMTCSNIKFMATVNLKTHFNLIYGFKINYSKF